MKELLIGNFRVDIKRSEVIYLKETFSLEPKFLQVLLLLAEKQGEIVTHKELLEAVWPNVIVEANTLQRCIARLRKIFHDDAKKQQVITTHPRKGYSLIADVKWQALANNFSAIPLEQPKKKFSVWTMAIFSLLLAIVIGFTSYTLFKTPQGPNIFSQITPLTATDKREYLVNFSPDGRYIAFNRHLSIHKNQIWIKDLQLEQEYLLTKDIGIYYRAAWSPDGQQIAFVLNHLKGENQTKPTCESLVLVSFPLAKVRPQSTKSILPCQQRNLESVSWISNHEIVFIDSQNNEQSVQVLNLTTGELTRLYTNTEQRIDSLAYSTRTGQLAIMQHDSLNINSLNLLDINSAEMREISLNMPPLFASNVHWPIAWHPHQDKLLTSNDNIFFEIALDGNVTAHPIASTQTLYHPVYHPDGNKVAVTMGDIDIDIGRLSWAMQQPANEHIEEAVLQRSIVNDYGGKYQPNTDDLAFISKRSGSDQLWVSQNNSVRRLSNFPSTSRVGSFVWSNEGNLLAVTLDRQLNFLDQNGELRAVQTPFKVLGVLQWTNEDQLLLNISDKQQRQIVLYDISSGQHQVLFDSAVKWAQLAQNKLYVLDLAGKFKRVFEGKAQHIDHLADIHASGSFIIKAQKLVLLDTNKAVWIVDLENKTKQQLYQGDLKMLRLDDVRIAKRDLLYSRYVSGRKEIVLFHP